jgi:uncharacterized membrane protein YsdA (DUF1294 family)
VTKVCYHPHRFRRHDRRARRTTIAELIARQPVTFTLLSSWLILNLVTWAVYRWDKRQSGRRGRRIPEQTLLRLAWYGGWLGALIAVYAHRARHKARKVAFLRLLWIASVTWLVGLAVIVLWAVTM